MTADAPDFPPVVLTTDDLWPRVPAFRYRIYARRANGELDVLAAAPDAGGIGQAIVTLDNDAGEVGGSLVDEGSLGVLDVMPGGEPSGTGRWLFKPWQASR